MTQTGRLIPRTKPIFRPPEGPFVLISGLLEESFWDSSESPFGTPLEGPFGTAPEPVFGASPDPGLALSGARPLITKSTSSKLKIRAFNHQVLVGTRLDRVSTTTQNWAARTPEIESGGGPPWPAIYGGGAPTPRLADI